MEKKMKLNALKKIMEMITIINTIIIDKQNFIQLKIFIILYNEFNN